MQETQVRSLGCKDPLVEEMETHSSILAWEIPWTEEARKLQSYGFLMGSKSILKKINLIRNVEVKALKRKTIYCILKI